ncbi:MAG: hypothetical protein ACI4FV_06210 [Lachnospiraceae bacterium]
MTTLYQKLRNEIENHVDFWNYYGAHFDDVLQNEEAAKNFIYNYFKNGSKSYGLNAWAESMEKNIHMRNMHTVNVFFIGILLQRNIDRKLAIKSEVASEYSFSYIWYLLSLAHDMGYIYEMYSKVYLSLPDKHGFSCVGRSEANVHYRRRRTRKDWYQRHGIDIAYLHLPFEGKERITFYGRSAILGLSNFIEFNNGTIVEKSRYLEEVKENYFFYRLYRMKTLDHGIVGADEFFSRMVSNYVKEYRVIAFRDFHYSNIYDFHNKDGLHFCSEQLKIFAYIADCIASHNIYKADDSKKCEEYMEYSLDCLLPDNFQRISYHDNPLLFILCVADTIEPSKRFTNYCKVDILKLISIDYNAKDKLLYVELDESLYYSEAGREYISNIKGLEEWCDIRTDVVCGL